jgi:hypothetical protein
MARKKRFGALPPRYRFALNPYRDVRFSRCPICEKATGMRKFALLIHIDTLGSVAPGKTCRYWATCAFIIAHQDALETELAALCMERAPEAIGRDYLVIGTLERSAWRRGLAGDIKLVEAMSHVADIKEYLDIEYDPCGWGPARGDV